MEKICNVVKKNDYVMVDICEGVKALDWLDGFEVNCGYKMVKVNIPSSVEDIGPLAFSDIPNIECFSVSPENTHFVEMDGCIYSADMSTLVVYPSSKVCECFEIPPTVEVIASGAFRGAQQLTCVKIGKNVRTIGYQAFARAYSIERIYIDENVQTIEYLFPETEDLDLYISYRTDLVIGGATGSNIEHWCYENAVRFCPLDDSQAEDFLASSNWNKTVPPLDEDKCLECYERRFEEAGFESE